MSNSQRFFNINMQIAENVNALMEEFLEPILEEERENLIKEGVKPEEVEKRIQEAKIDTQAKYLPMLKEMFKERLREKIREEKNSNLNATNDLPDRKAGQKFSK